MEQLISHGMHECRSACHELVVVRILVFAPMSVDAYLLDEDDWAIFHASTRAAAANAHGGLISVRLSCRLAQVRTGETRDYHEEPPRAVPTRGAWPMEWLKCLTRN